MQKGVDFTGICITFICHDGKGNFVMAKRSQNARDEKGKWDVGAGALEFDEDVYDTLRREVKEEYGVDIIEEEFLGFRDAHREYDGKKTHWIALDFKVFVDREKVINNEPHKFDEIGWFTADNLPKEIHSQNLFQIQKYKDKI